MTCFSRVSALYAVRNLLSIRGMIRLLFAAFFLTVVHVFSPVNVQAQADYKRYYDEDNLPKVRDIFGIGRFDFVLQICDYALERGQPSWEWRVLRFESLANLGRYEEAIAEAGKTAELFPKELGAQLRITIPAVSAPTCPAMQGST